MTKAVLYHLEKYVLTSTKRKVMISKITLMNIIFFCLITNCFKVMGQNELLFYYEVDNSFKYSISSQINLVSPTGKMHSLYNDTIKKFDLKNYNILSESGKYKLFVFFKSERYGNDSIFQEFNLNGHELNTTISVSFSYCQKESHNHNNQTNMVSHGHVSIQKIYNANPAIKISYDPNIRSSEDYREPFFLVQNNSKDTIYGDFDPGYLWGTLTYINKDKTHQLLGMIDGNFAHNPPLYPDSTTIASVGSFGVFHKIPPNKYHFEVKYALNNSGKGIQLYKKNNNFVWWAGIKEFYLLICNFEVK